MSRYLTVATLRVTRTSVVYIECIIIYVEIYYGRWDYSACIFIRGHTTVATLTLHDRADVVGLVIWDEILYIYKLSERKKEFNRDVHMDDMYRIIWLHWVYICIYVCVYILYYINNNIDTLVIKVTFYITYYQWFELQRVIFCFDLKMTEALIKYLFGCSSFFKRLLNEVN